MQKNTKQNIQKDIKLYNVMFPIWFLIIFPITWLIILPVNFIIDSVVLLISAKLLKLTNLKEVYKKTILKVWLIGFASDFVGAGILFLSTSGSGVWYEYLNAVSWNPFDNWFSILYVAFATVVAGLLIYLGNLKLVFRGLELEVRNKKILALALAVFTAPYVFFYPSTLIHGGSWDRLDFLTHHFVWSDEFRLEVEPASGESNQKGPIVLYYYENEIKDAINTAKKISNDNAIKSRPDYILTFYNRDYTKNKAIPLWLKDGKEYFSYNGSWYEMNQSKFPSFKEVMGTISENRGKLQFTITPDPETAEAEASDRQKLDKEGERADKYPIYQDSRSLYYFPNKEYFYTATIEIEGMDRMDLYIALERGLITPRELIDYGMDIKVESRAVAESE